MCVNSILTESTKSEGGKSSKSRRNPGMFDVSSHNHLSLIIQLSQHNFLLHYIVWSEYLINKVSKYLLILLFLCCNNYNTVIDEWREQATKSLYQSVRCSILQEPSLHHHQHIDRGAMIWHMIWTSGTYIVEMVWHPSLGNILNVMWLQPWKSLTGIITDVLEYWYISTVDQLSSSPSNTLDSFQNSLVVSLTMEVYMEGTALFTLSIPHNRRWIEMTVYFTHPP